MKWLQNTVPARDVKGTTSQSQEQSEEQDDTSDNDYDDVDNEEADRDQLNMEIEFSNGIHL